MPSYSQTGTGGMRLGGSTLFLPPPLITFRTDYIRQILSKPDSADLRVSWTSLELPGAWYQLYVNGKLQPPTQQLWTHIPYPTTNVILVVGAVPANLAHTDFSASLPPTPQRRIDLTWIGGNYLDPDGNLAGYNIYLGPTPGAAVSYVKPAATVPAYSGRVLDGFGLGGFGEGGFGSAASHYEWTSDLVQAGTWNVGIKSVDLYGNESTSALTGSAVITGPPEPPARDTGGSRLHYTYDVSTHQITLTWLASPSF